MPVSCSAKGGAVLTNDELYALCAARHYRIRSLPLQSAPAASLPSGWIAVNPEQLTDPSVEKAVLAHELGHLETGSFSTGSDADHDGRHEERANRWAIRTLIPAPQLCHALESGKVELYQLAEEFGVPEEWILKAFSYYCSASPLSLTEPEQQAVRLLRGYQLAAAAFREAGAPVLAFLRVERRDFQQDGFRLVLDEE
ncbi:MAG: hypothetical protein DBX44_00160 [Oscillospiraceae bacterium]|nr:MAG: hypothetical protein DBX44_00160 [Oscillospiraceae bacterium]